MNLQLQSQMKIKFNFAIILLAMIEASVNGADLKIELASEISKVVAAVKADFGRIDILVNSAGVFYPTPVGETLEADYDRMMDINLKVEVFLHLLKHLRLKILLKLHSIREVVLEML